MSDPADPHHKLPDPLRTTVTSTPVLQPLRNKIGPYKLMEKIGEGGFGLVYVAEQQSPVKRKVALKVIKPGMDSREVIARFEAERQALAMMDHPNIARVFDAGTTELGHPYFVMELVRGVPITEYCDEQRLTMRERLELFVSVCQAVQHAHQKGIIHRDIKPSNVLVTLHDGRPVVKVIDFGVAKAVHQQLTDKTIYTRFAQVIGTPLYMSPEQAEMSGLDIDTRSDIYSLGVMLYELLTGTTPFDRERLAKLALDERVQIIRHEEPPKPSTRLRQSGDTLPSIAEQRRIEPAKLSRMFRGDLDWITMKALEKDRTRRYETASALAADVLRYLQDEPVEASPPSTAYRLKKFARRYRKVLATATAFVALLLAGIVVSAGFAISESKSRGLAEQLRLQADDEAKNSRAAEREAEWEKRLALKAEAKAVAARADEEAQRKNALAALDRSEKSLYLNRIALAERNWQANNPRRAGEILDACPPKFRDWEWNYLNRLVHAELLTLPGDNAVSSPDGVLLATSDGEAVRIRNARSGKISMILRGGHAIPFVQSLAFSPDSRRLAAVCQDGEIWIWDLVPNGRTLKIRVRLSEETIKSPLDHPVTLAFSPDGKRIAMAGVESEKLNEAQLRPDDLVVWDAMSGKELLKVSGTGRSVAFSSDGKRLAMTRCTFVKIGSTLQGPFTEGIRILAADTGAEVLRFAPWERDGPHHYRSEDDCHLVFSPNGKWLASARGNEIKIWDAATAKEAQTLRGHSLPVTRLAFNEDSKRLASASRDETVRIWNPQRSDALAVYRGHVGTVAGVSFCRGDGIIASTGQDHTVRLWSASAEQGPRDISGVNALMGSIGVSPDGALIAMARVEGVSAALVLMDPSTGRQTRTLRLFPRIADSVAPHASLVFSSDGRRLASAFEKDVQVWDVAVGEELAHFSGLFDFERRGLAFSPDAARLAFSASDDSVEVWDIHDRKRLVRYPGHQGPVTTIAFSPRGDRVASGSTDGTVQVWQAATGQKICTLEGSRVQACVVFSPDGTQLLASTADKAVCVWDLEKQARIRTLRGHKMSVWGIAFNPTGTRVATVGGDRVTRLWTWPDCEEILSLTVHDYPVSVGFAGQGRELVTLAFNSITVWDAAPSPAPNRNKE